MSIEEDNVIIEQARKILKKRVNRNRTLNSTTAVREWLQMELCNHEHEVFWVIFLNSQHKILAKEEMFRGTIDGSAVYPREVVKACLKHNANAVIFSHNHPSGVCEPSQADNTITQKLKQALQLIDVRILDHFVLGGYSSYSFAEKGMI